MRGQHADYDAWSNLGAVGWSWADVAPYFRKSETYAGGGDTLRGDEGGLQVGEVSHRNPTNDAVLSAFKEIGVPQNADYNGPDQFGAFYYQTTVAKGRRCSAADAFLRPASARPNLRVLTGVECRRVLFDGKRATGIEIDGPRGIELITARREVILSAGAYHSPKLLMLSGIGPASQLSGMGISVVHDSPQAGENLQDHYILTMSWRLRPGVYSYNSELSRGRLIWNVLRYIVRREGAMTIPAAQVGAFVKSDPALDRPDIQFHCLPVTGDLDAAAAGRKSALSPWPGLTLGPNILRPESRGHVRLGSPDPAAVPKSSITGWTPRRTGDCPSVRCAWRANWWRRLRLPGWWRAKPGPARIAAAMTNFWIMRAATATPAIIRLAPAAWASMMGLCLIRNCACAAFRDCVLSTHRPCRAWCRAIQMPHPL